MSDMHRRDFIRKTSTIGLGVFATTRGLVAQAPARRSANEKVVMAVIGVNGRGEVLAKNAALIANSEVACICDVDSSVLAKGVAATGTQAKPPKTVADFRRILDDRSVDALVMATPDHWHAPMTLLAMQAGKHVYLEKPSGNTPEEDELLMRASRQYDVRVQLGTQRRSGPRFFEAIEVLKAGTIGRPYHARTWYANTRGTIGKGKPAPVPPHLDWELWQGPAPRTAYRDNIVHYNWHWFTNWGTGEICNNGTHEIDVARWLLGVDYPTTVSSHGGRYHFDDDWQFPDLHDATFEFANGTSIVWHGQSRNGLPMYGRGRGTLILGTNGSMIIDQDGYVISDLKGKVVTESRGVATEGGGLNTRSDDPLTELHMRNFVDAIRTGARLNAPIEDGARTGLLCHLGTIAQQTGRKLRTDPRTGRILGDADAARLWGRTYAPGWKPTL